VKTATQTRISSAIASRKEPVKPQDALADVASGLSARAAVDVWRARRLMREEMIAAEQLVWRHQVEEATAMLWEMVGNDLRYTLPGEVADRMPNAAAAHAARKAVRDAVEVIIGSWKKAGATIETDDQRIAAAGAEPEDKPAKKGRPKKSDNRRRL